MVAISIGWQPDGDLGGNRQPLDDTAVLVVCYANDHGDSSFAGSIACRFFPREEDSDRHSLIQVVMYVWVWLSDLAARAGSILLRVNSESPQFQVKRGSIDS